MNDEKFFDQYYEDPPEDFKNTLYVQLQALDALDDTSREERDASQQPSGNKIIHFRRRFRGATASGIAAIMAILFAGLILINGITVQDGSLSQTDSDVSLDALQPITLDNVSQLQPIRSLGRGVLYDISWSPNNSAVASATGSGVYIHNPEDLNDIRLLPGTEGHVATSAVYNADGSVLASRIRENSIRVWDTTNYETIANIQFTDNSWAYSHITFIQDDMTIAVLMCLDSAERPPGGCEQFAVRYIDYRSGESLREITLPQSFHAVSHVGDVIAYVDREKDDLTFISAETGEILNQISVGDQRQIEGLLSFNRDGSQLLSGGVSNGRVQVWNTSDLLSADANANLSDIVPTMDFRLTASDGRNGIGYLIFSADGDTMVISGFEGATEVWSMSENQQTAVITTSAKFPSPIALSPNGDRLLSVSGGGVLAVWELGESDDPAIIDTTTAEGFVDIGFLGGFGNYDMVNYSDDGRHLVASFSDARNAPARYWDLNSESNDGFSIRNPDQNSITDNVVGANISPDGSTIVFNTVERNGNDSIEGLYRFDVATGDYTPISSQNMPDVESLPVIDDEGVVWRVLDQPVTLVLDRSHPSIPIRLSTDSMTWTERGGLSLDYNPSMSLVAGTLCTGGSVFNCESDVRVWDTVHGDNVLRLVDSDYDEVEYDNNSVLHFSDDGNYVIVLSCFVYGEMDRFCEQSGIRIWDVSEAESLRDTRSTMDRMSDDFDESTIPEPLTLEPVVTILDTAEAEYNVGMDTLMIDVDTMLVATSDFNGTFFYEVDLSTGEATIIHEVDDAQFPHFSPTGDYVTMSRSGVIQLWAIPE